MSVRDFVESYWRVLALVLFIAAALAALFVPGGVFADDAVVDTDNESEAEQSLTNLVYGLGLDGGTRISAPPVGMTAEDLDIDPDRAGEVETALHQYDYEDADLEPADVMVRFDSDANTHTAEVFSKNVTQEEFAAALQSAGVDATTDDIRDGVTSTTRSEMISTIESKINEAGLSGGRVTEQAALGGEYFIVTEVPDRTPAELRNLLSERGVVQVLAHYPNENGTYVNETVLERDDLDRIGTASYNERRDYHYVPVTVSQEEGDDGESEAERYERQMREFGFTTNTQQCDYGNETSYDQYCLLTTVDGEVVDAHSMGSDLGSSMHNGQWSQDPQFEMITPTQQDAQELAVNLQAGSLRAPLDFENDRTFSLEPALADQFKLYSLFIGVLSVITVSGVVYLRYADARVAAPMVVTALSEVLILLGFAAAIRMPLDLSHVAGFIAVVGTGVDDLIIIADEVMSEGDVNSRRVFESRFRKAFWVIGAAAATTVIAMSPLAVLSLGDLRGFAIVTILGVLIGVFVTRPAYGDILRHLLTER